MSQTQNISDKGDDKSSEKSVNKIELKAEHVERAEASKAIQSGSLNDATRATRLEQYKTGNSGITGKGDEQGRFRSAKEIFGDAAHTPLTKEAEANRAAEFQKRGWNPDELQGKKADHENIQGRHKDGSVLLKVNEPLPDRRNVGEKIQDFLQAATKRATDPEGWKAWTQAELTKVSGIGAGLNEAKDETKAALAAGFKAMTDGAVIEFLSHPNAINAPVFKTVENAFDAMGKDPQAVNKAFEALGKVVLKASEQYSNLPEYEKGKAIGNAMFYMINLEGSLEAPQTAMKAAENTAQGAAKVADAVATHVDKAVMDTIKQTVQLIDQAAKNSPETARRAEQMLYDYLKNKGLTTPEMEYAGVPKQYLQNMQDSAMGGKGDNFVAMSKADGLANESGGIRNTGMDTAGRPLSFSQDSGIELAAAKPGQDGLWKEVPMVRGNEVHVGLGENLPSGTRTIDRVVIKDGVAESIKSIDPRLDSYKEPSDLRNKLNDYVRKMQDYEGQPRRRAGFQMNKSAIDEKILHFGVPDGALTPQQVKVFEDVGRDVMKYNQSLPVDKPPLKIKVTVLK